MKFSTLLLTPLFVCTSAVLADEEDHDDHGDEVHSEFQASYLWNCHHADDLDSVQTRMMKVFPRIEEIRVQWIVGDRQGAMELENQDGKIRGWR